MPDKRRTVFLGKGNFLDLRPGFYITQNLFGGYDCFEQYGRCGNRCSFCCDTEFKKNKEFHLNPSVKRNTASAGKKIILCCGEPTGIPGIIDTISGLKKKYRVVSLSTNGRRLKDAEFAARILEAGVDEMFISLHGHNAKIHDSVTGREGSFTETVRGIHNAVALTRSGNYNADIGVNAVLIKKNVCFLGEFVRLIGELNIKTVNFDTLVPVGLGKKAYRYEMPRFTDILSEFAKLYHNGKGRHKNLRIFLSNMPLCLCGGLKNTPHKFLLNKKAGEFSDLIYPDLRHICGQCAVSLFCEGIFSDYVNIYGLREFR